MDRDNWIGVAVLFVVLLLGFGLGYVSHPEGSASDISPRAVDHIYGAAVSFEAPGLSSTYLRWCDPTGYLVFASSLEKEATLTVVRDSRCDGVGR